MLTEGPLVELKEINYSWYYLSHCRYLFCNQGSICV